ncbi:MAG: hypothetical protein ABEI52_04625, partial [Halobacteriaceae archaeon]
MVWADPDMLLGVRDELTAGEEAVFVGGTGTVRLKKRVVSWTQIEIYNRIVIVMKLQDVLRIIRVVPG